MTCKNGESAPGKADSNSPIANITIAPRPNKLHSRSEVMKRAQEFLNENPLLSQNNLAKKLRYEGLSAGSSKLDMIYNKHRRTLSRGH